MASDRAGRTRLPVESESALDGSRDRYAFLSCPEWAKLPAELLGDHR